MITLKDIRDSVRNKLAEDSNVFFTDAIIRDAINTALSKVAEDLETFEVVCKSLITPTTATDGINAPEGFIEIRKLFVNNQLYRKISFPELDEYLGNTATKDPSYVYYVRNFRIIFLDGLKAKDELTLYFTSNYPELVGDDDSISLEFTSFNFKDLLVVGACWLLKERDEDFTAAKYYASRFVNELNVLNRRNKARARGKLQWRKSHITMNDNLRNGY